MKTSNRKFGSWLQKEIKRCDEVDKWQEFIALKYNKRIGGIERLLYGKVWAERAKGSWASGKVTWEQWNEIC